MKRSGGWMVWGGVLCGVLVSCGGEAQPDKVRPAKPSSGEKSFEQVEKEANCLACHLPSNQMGAPTWRDVVIRYKNKGAERYLAQKIINGGAGAWGSMDMPPYQELSEAEAILLVEGIMRADTKQ